MIAARTRIGRVTLKEGGADLRVLPVRSVCKVSAELRDFAIALDKDVNPPRAMVSIVFWPGKEVPWMADYHIHWTTEDGYLPHAALMARAASQIGAEAGAVIGSNIALDKLGYRTEPEDAS